jgi:hypothetical protein
LVRSLDRAPAEAGDRQARRFLDVLCRSSSLTPAKSPAGGAKSISTTPTGDRRVLDSSARTAPEWRNDHPYGLRLDSHGLRECAGAVPTPHGLVEVRVPGSEAEIDSPVPAVVVHENGTETQLEAGQHRATIR